MRQAMAYCAQHKLVVLVVDTFDRWSGLRGEAENAAGSVNEALEPFQYAAAAGLAVLLISHQRKSSGEFGEAVRRLERSYGWRRHRRRARAAVARPTAR